mmetsp:Transcript_39942/g.58716  ORF Transcript_39942/g.58716 Transcript_39942/m.58716 type:complete len:624 (-) Transcript_39942:140-2011(-)
MGSDLALCEDEGHQQCQQEHDDDDCDDFNHFDGDQGGLAPELRSGTGTFVAVKSSVPLLLQHIEEVRHVVVDANFAGDPGVCRKCEPTVVVGEPSEVPVVVRDDGLDAERAVEARRVQSFDVTVERGGIQLLPRAFLVLVLRVANGESMAGETFRGPHNAVVGMRPHGFRRRAVFGASAVEVAESGVRFRRVAIRRLDTVDHNLVAAACFVPLRLDPLSLLAEVVLQAVTVSVPAHLPAVFLAILVHLAGTVVHLDVIQLVEVRRVGARLVRYQDRWLRTRVTAVVGVFLAHADGVDGGLHALGPPGTKPSLSLERRRVDFSQTAARLLLGLLFFPGAAVISTVVFVAERAAHVVQPPLRNGSDTGRSFGFSVVVLLFFHVDGAHRVHTDGIRGIDTVAGVDRDEVATIGDVWNGDGVHLRALVRVVTTGIEAPSDLAEHGSWVDVLGSRRGVGCFQFRNFDFRSLRLGTSAVVGERPRRRVNAETSRLCFEHLTHGHASVQDLRLRVHLRVTVLGHDLEGDGGTRCIVDQRVRRQGPMVVLVLPGFERFVGVREVVRFERSALEVVGDNVKLVLARTVPELDIVLGSHCGSTVEAGFVRLAERRDVRDCWRNQHGRCHGERL